jgi:hypothetical protein
MLGQGSSSSSSSSKDTDVLSSSPATTTITNTNLPRPSGASSLHYFPGFQSAASMSPKKASINKSSSSSLSKAAPTAGGDNTTTSPPEKAKRRSGSLFKIKRRRNHKPAKGEDEEEEEKEEEGHPVQASKGGVSSSSSSSAAGSSPFLAKWLTQSDRQNKLRTVVKVLTLLCFSPFFALQWGINKCATANQTVLDWSPAVVDVIYQHLVAPVAHACLRVTSVVARAWHQHIFLPVYTLVCSSLNLLVPPISNAWASLKARVHSLVHEGLLPRLRVVPQYCWQQVCGAYVLVTKQWLPVAWAQVCGVGPWCHATFVKPVVEGVTGATKSVVGAVMDKAVLPVYTPVRDAVVGGYTWGKDGVEVVGLCYRILMQGQDPATA